MPYITDLGLPQGPSTMSAEDVAKLLWSASVRSIPFTYKNAKDLKIGEGNRVTMVRVGTPEVEVADSNYNGPVALMFAPQKALAVFSIYYYSGKMLNDIPEKVSRHVTNAHGADMFIGSMQVDGFFYRVDYIADRNGAVPYNLEFNPDEQSIDDDILHELKLAMNSTEGI
jgi:hypothetical protein